MKKVLFTLTVLCAAFALASDKAARDDEACPVNPNVRGHEDIEWSHATAYNFTSEKRNLPRVLLIGDSICNGYQNDVRQALDGKVNVSYWVSSYCLTMPAYLKLLGFYLDEAKYDVIHLNNGLHSLETDPLTWQKSFRETIEFIRKRQPKAKIIWCNATPLKKPELTARAKRLNELADEVLKDFSEVQVNDFFARLDPLDRETHWRDTFHHREPVRKQLAQWVVEAVQKALGNSETAKACERSETSREGAVGLWAIEKQGAFWMGVCDKDGQPKASKLWAAGSPNPYDEVKIDGATATMKRNPRKKNADPAKDRYETATLMANGANAEITIVITDGTGKEVDREVVKAKRIPALPPAPDRSKAVFGDPVNLLADGINGWESMNPKNYFGWSVKDGVLSNRIKRTAEGKRDGASANIRTKRDDFFEFKISYDVRVLPGCNSGVYLRGIYELQVLDSYGRNVDSHHMAALYGRIRPRVAAEKPAGEWQHVDAMLYKRHLTVTLNGVNIIDNEPVLGCTGGAITSDEFVNGPFYLQGDHSDADFRNIIVTPIVK